MDSDGEKGSSVRSSEKEPVSTGVLEDVEDGVGPEPPAQSSAPKEDLFAWMQVFGAFCLNLTTW